jgi:hypothetical protein
MSQFQDAYPPPEPQPPRSSSGKWIWIVLLAVILPIVACAGVCGGVVFLLRGSAEKIQETVQEAVKEGTRAAPPFRIALERIQADAEVKSRLGEPIQEGFPAVFNYHEGTDGGDAEFRYSVSGPRGTAQVHVVSEKIDEQWWFTTLDVTFQDGKTCDLADVELPIKLD